MEKKKSSMDAPSPASDKKKALETAIAQIEKNFGKGTVMRLGDKPEMQVDAIPTGSLALDAALPRKLVLDLGGVTFMDSSGIALILRAQQRMQMLDGSLLVCNVPRQARRVLDAAGIGRLVTIR